MLGKLSMLGEVLLGADFEPVIAVHEQLAVGEDGDINMSPLSLERHLRQVEHEQIVPGWVGPRMARLLLQAQD